MHFTQNPIGSDSQLDLQDNAIALDYAMNSPAALWQDRFGKQHKTVQQALKDVGFKPAGFDFVTGGTLGIGDRDKCVFYPTDGYWYSWNGKLPYAIPANSSPTPGGSKGWKLIIKDDTIIAREALRRTYQEVGLNLVEGSFEQGALLSNQNDVVLYELNGKVYSGPLGKIQAGTVPSSPYFTDVTGNLLNQDTLNHYSILENLEDNKNNLSSLISLDNRKLPIDGKLRKIKSSSLNGTEHLINTQVVTEEVIKVCNVTPEAFGGFYSACYNGGKQLYSLAEALQDPKFQKFGITFIGDSITWGTGSTGIETGSDRNGTLGDFRNNSRTCSYVNEMRRWIKDQLGITVLEEKLNHPYASGQGGESISVFKTEGFSFPKGDEFVFTKGPIGLASTEIKENLDGPFLRGRREIIVNNNGVGNLTFNMTGDSFTLIYAGIPTGAYYNVIVMGTKYGPFSTRSGDPGVEYGFNKRRKHSFPYVKNTNITIEVIQYPGETANNGLYIEGLMFEREIKVKNQGIIGASTGSYLSYNFPPSLTSNLIKRLTNMTGFKELSTGVTNLSVIDTPQTLTGEQRRYSFLNNSEWDLSFNIPAGYDQLIVAYSSISNTGAIDVLANDILVGTIHTSDKYPGNTYGYKKTVEITIPTTTTKINLKSKYEMLGGGNTCYLYLEGVGYKKSTDLSYPDNNSFNKGLCLDSQDCFMLMQLGTNDRGNNRIQAPEQISSNISSMLNLLPRDCQPILLATPPAVTELSHRFNTNAVRAAVAKIARERKIDMIDNHSLFGNCPVQYWTTDGLHPNDAGHALIAKNIIAAIMRSS